ncbi:tyrosine-type recombinase/integrase [Roseateles violae]|uniref:Site-specific integrase n=1 Tax=Roseateles violae TaxID=3058042 RepID=A0ABT8DSK2_9BURK|nr:site-specific integrase [Pelomonas sp. PFR6]MDN3920038.1 site-specific integrase [Pelomonas sp. PFR6]
MTMKSRSDGALLDVAEQGLNMSMPMQMRRWVAAWPKTGCSEQMSPFPSEAQDGIVAEGVPIEAWSVGGLDGSDGRFRAPAVACMLEAANDYEAIQAWLHAKCARQRFSGRSGARSRGHETVTTDHTLRAYRREAERFLLWCVLERQLSLSSATHEDCLAYLDFIQNPVPAARWCAPRGHRRWTPEWRPFEGPLNAGARRQVQVILSSLFRYLREVGYLCGNPLAGVGAPQGQRPCLEIGRSLSAAQWALVWRAVAEETDHPVADDHRSHRTVGTALQYRSESRGLGTVAVIEVSLLRPMAATWKEQAAKARLRVVLFTLYLTGLRLSELAGLKLSDLRRLDHHAGGCGSQDSSIHVSHARGANLETAPCMLSVIGKGGRRREVPVPQALLAELRRSMLSRGLGSDPWCLGIADAAWVGALVPETSANVKKTPAHAPSLAKDLANRKRHVSASLVHKVLKEFFADLASQLHQQGRVQDAEHLLRASAHWLRHTHASHTLAAGIPVEMVRANLGHSSLATTSLYITAPRDARIAAMESFSQTALGSANLPGGEKNCDDARSPRKRA